MASVIFLLMESSAHAFSAWMTLDTISPGPHFLIAAVASASLKNGPY
jgi:hypothetical protein